MYQPDDNLSERSLPGAITENDNQVLLMETDSFSRKRGAGNDSDGNAKKAKGLVNWEGANFARNSEFQYFVTLRGLPWNASPQDVMSFLSNINVTEDMVYILHNAKGEAFVRLRTEKDRELCLKHDRNTLGRRYIEVFIAMKDSVEDSLKAEQIKGLENPSYPGVIRMRGLPWSATEEDIRSFFSDFTISKTGIQIALNRDGRSSGEAYVTFSKESDAKEALKLDKEKIGDRWIDLFESTRGEMYALTGKPVPPDGRHGDLGDGDFRGVLRMRGLPYEVTKSEIEDFFDGFEVSAKNVFIINGIDGRPTGEAYVIFQTEQEAADALKFDKKKLGNRWIDLFQTYKANLYEKISYSDFQHLKPDSAYAGVLKLRGLPFSAKAADVLEFFKDYELSESDVTLTTIEDGRPSGEGYVVFKSESDAESAIQLNKEKIGDRWIELFASTKADLYSACLGRSRHQHFNIGGRYADSGGLSRGQYPVREIKNRGLGIEENSALTCAKLRGLPYQVTEQDIFEFFHGIDVIGIFICKDLSGRPTGEGFVEFSTVMQCRQGLQRDRDYMLNRYIQVYPCTKADVLQEINGQGQNRYPGPRRQGGSFGFGAPPGRFHPGAQGPMRGYARMADFPRTGGYADQATSTNRRVLGRRYGGNGR